MKPLPAHNEDPLVAQLRGIMAQCQMAITEIERRNAQQVSEHQGMIEAARLVARSDDMSSQDVADYLGVSRRSVHQGFAGTACLYRARMTNGRNVRHLRRRVELHRQNVETRGHCDDCDKANFARLRMV